MGRFQRCIGVTTVEIRAERLKERVLWRGRFFEPGDWRQYDEAGHTLIYELDGTFQRHTEPLDAAARAM